MFKGSFVALVTPFKNNALDEKKLRDMVEFHVSHKTAGLVPCGTTGESATLSYAEHYRVIDIVVRQARGRIPVIAGTGSNSTSEAIELTRHAKSVGADACLVIVPYYNKPTQAGLINHFTLLAKAVSIPQIVYNIPSRTGVNMLPRAIIQLARKIKNIVGVKESSGSLDQVTEIINGVKDRKDFSVLCGDDSLTLPMMALGAHGTVSVLANIDPRGVADLCAAAAAGDMKKARALHYRMYPLVKALFIETSPAPVKTAMEMLGMFTFSVRPPLCELMPESRKKLAQEIKNYFRRKP